VADVLPLSSLLGDDLGGGQPAQKAGIIDAFRNTVPTLADGTPDYATMVRTYYQLGDVGTATQLARLAARESTIRGRSAKVYRSARSLPRRKFPSEFLSPRPFTLQAEFISRCIVFLSFASLPE